MMILSLLSLPMVAQVVATADEVVVFKETPQRELRLYIFYPEDDKKVEGRTAIVSFFGGGWAGGNPNQFFEQSRYYSSLGMVGISAEYRVKNSDQTTPFESVMDGKSAVRWVRGNSERLAIDPCKIVTSGGSAGGHVAACTALIEGVEDDKDLEISSMPNAMILFNPVVNTTADGYGADKLPGRERELSPVHHVRENMPPTLILHGTNDRTVPYQNAVDFTSAMVEKGNICQLVSFTGEDHGFFNTPLFRADCKEENYQRCLSESIAFLKEIGF